MSNKRINGQVNNEKGDVIAYIESVNKNYTKVVLLDEETPYICLIFDNLTEKQYIEKARVERKMGIPSYKSEENEQ